MLIAVRNRAANDDQVLVDDRRRALIDVSWIDRPRVLVGQRDRPVVAEGVDGFARLDVETEETVARVDEDVEPFAVTPERAAAMLVPGGGNRTESEGLGIVTPELLAGFRVNGSGVAVGRCERRERRPASTCILEAHGYRSEELMPSLLVISGRGTSKWLHCQVDFQTVHVPDVDVGKRRDLVPA